MQSQAESKHRRSADSLLKRSKKSFFEALARRRLERNGALWECLKSAEAATASTGCTYTELGWLYDYVTTRRPAHILECGAGMSTIVIGFAVRELDRIGQRPPTFVSMEDVPFYRDNLRKLMPDALEPYVDLQVSPVEDTDYGWGIGRSYAKVPDHPYRFVFTDGPNLPANSEKPYFDCDYVDAVRRQRETVVGALDGRKSTRAAYARLFPRAPQGKLPRVGFYSIEASSSDLVT